MSKGYIFARVPISALYRLFVLKYFNRYMYCIFQNQMILPNTLRVQLTNLENAPDCFINTFNITSITHKVNRT